MRLALAGFALALLWGFCSPLYAQVDAPSVQRLGLESAWKSQVQVPIVGTGVVSSHLWPDAQNPRQYAVVELDSQTIRVSAEALDKDGNAIGLEAAKTQAQQQAAKLLGRNDGFEVVEVTVPRIKLVMITSDGLVQNLDAETGEVLWTQGCGSSHAPAFPGTVSPMGVSLIHGEDLYLLDWATGKSLLTKRMRLSTSNAIAVCGDIAFVSDFTGRVQAIGLSDRTLPRFSYVMQGKAVGPTASFSDQTFCAIASDAGYVYVYAGGETPRIYIRYETSSALTGSLTAGNNAFYAGTSEGLVTKITVEDRLGTIKWELRTDTTVSTPPLVVGKSVYVASESGELVAIEDDSGIVQWTSNVDARQPIALAGDLLYCITLTGQLLAIDAQTGVVSARTRPLVFGRPIVNQMNDRVYLLSKYGQLQCLRPVGADLPSMIMPVVIPETEEGANGSALAATPTESSGEAGAFSFDAAGSATSGNPFGGGDTTTNPFGGAGETSNPFGDTSPQSPFGGNADGMTNPFGSSEGGDPFPETGNSSGGSGN